MFAAFIAFASAFFTWIRPALDALFAFLGGGVV